MDRYSCEPNELQICEKLNSDLLHLCLDKKVLESSRSIKNFASRSLKIEVQPESNSDQYLGLTNGSFRTIDHPRASGRDLPN